MKPSNESDVDLFIKQHWDEEDTSQTTWYISYVADRQVRGIIAEWMVTYSLIENPKGIPINLPNWEWIEDPANYQTKEPNND